MIQAVLFDFDGLILDTETTLYDAWRQTYETWGCTLTLEQWGPNVGGHSYETFHPLDFLVENSPRKFVSKTVDRARYELYKNWVWRQPALPGAARLLKSAKEQGIRVGMASSSHREWVQGHMERLGLWQYVDAGAFGDEVDHSKPAPDIYLKALKDLDVDARNALALEDSPKGVTAAKAAGLFCIAVPNLVTAVLDLDHADHRLPSLESATLHGLIDLVQKERAHAL